MSSFRRINKRPAFILVALLIAMTVSLAISASLIMMLDIAVRSSTAMLDQRIAINRAQSAASLMKAPVFYCGYGMPSDADDYQRAFMSQTQSEPFNWQGPVSVADRNGRKNAELRISYGMPSHLLTNYAFAASGTDVSISLKQAFDKGYDLIRPSYFGKPNNVKNWLLFGAMVPPAVPVAVKSVSGATVKVRGTSDGLLIPEGDEPYLFRAMKFYCDSGLLYTQNYRSSGAQPRTQGIVDLRFELDSDKKFLTVYIISRGNLIAGGQPLKNADDWPEEYKTAAINSRYNLYASKITWSLPNCIGADLSQIKGIAARF